MRIIDLFEISNARSKGFEDHASGAIPFVSNGLGENNGVVGFVTPLLGERVFYETAVCVSCFCEATIQKAPFLPRGNGGSGMVVLSPKESMGTDELYYYAAIINLQRWRFSFGRMVIGNRLKTFKIKKPTIKYNVMDSVRKLVPKPLQKKVVDGIRFSNIPVSRLFDIMKGKGEYYENCNPGSTPLVSATGGNNGVMGHIDSIPLFKAPMITLERVSGNAFVQVEDFVTVPDDIFVLKPKRKMGINELFYYASMLNLRKWRFNYSRKITPSRFKHLEIPVPVDENNELDLHAVNNIVAKNYGWESILRASK